MPPISLVVNGETHQVEVSPEAASNEIFLGGRNDNFANLKGSLDEVALFDRALSPGQLPFPGGPPELAEPAAYQGKGRTTSNP